MVATVERPRLVEQVEAGVAGPLTLVSAPAGSGKTVLLGEWMRQHPTPVACLPVGREHADPPTFWTDLVAVAGVAVPALSGLEVPPRSHLLDGFLRGFAGAVSTLEEPLVVVLDDLHLVRSPRVTADLEWLLDRAEPGLRLVLSTRSDPPMRFERLRLGGRMTEIRAPDLAFTLPEAGALFREMALPAAEVEMLWRRTEGWVGALRLAQMSLEREKDRGAFVRGFAGDDRAVSDYLMTEVVARQPPKTHDFLMRTCIVDRVSGELADALTLRHDGDELLRGLERAHGLASAEPGGWYRYHPLLLSVLQAESRRRLPDEQRLLHRRAGRWHAERGSGLAAVMHAVDAADWELAGEVLRDQWLAFVTRGRASALRRLAERMPSDIVSEDAELTLALAGLKLEGGDEAGADELMPQADRLAARLPADRARRFAAASTATNLYRARMRGDVTEALAAARVALSEQWERDVVVDVRALTLANLGVAEFWAGELEAAADHLRQAAGLALECGNDYVLFLADAYGAAVDASAGRLAEAEARGRTAVERAERRGWALVAHAAIAYAALATVHIWQNELRDVRALADRASDALDGSTEPLLGPAVALLRAQVIALEGNPLAALDLVRGAIARGPLPAILRAPALLLEAELWLALVEPGRARERLVELEHECPDAHVALARLALADGDPGRALRSVAMFLADERPPAVAFSQLEGCVIDAVARDAIRDERGALYALEQALEMAEPRGCLAPLLRYGPLVRPLLRRLVAQGTRHRGLAVRFLAMLERAPRAEGATGKPLLDPLSERELTVLRYLPTMMSNAEIAAEMYVSVNTVKTHLKHVYRKLDVADRRACVERGRELRLLSPSVAER